MEEKRSPAEGPAVGGGPAGEGPVNEKKSFLIYMDAYMHVLTLPMEQRGQLFTSLFWFAGRVAQKGFLDVTAAAAQFTGMSPEAKMAFYFMADAIQRDTLLWREKQANYRAAARRREARRQGGVQSFRGRGVDVYPDEGEGE